MSDPTDDLNLAAPLRLALIDSAEIADLIAAYELYPAVFTRRPTPPDAAFPLIIINPDASIGDQDALNSARPVVRRDVAVYGKQPDDYRAVDQCGYLIRRLFHRKRFAIAVPGFHVIDIVAAGPMVGPVDGPEYVARVVPLTIRLQALP